MGTDLIQEIRLKYRDEFRSVHGEAFQHWFERLAHVLHGQDCFLPIRITRGDGGLDGLVLLEGRVYQLYAPPSLGTDASTARKVTSDFLRARDTLGESLKAWTFVHNSPDGKVGHRTAQALARLKDDHPETQIEAFGIDGLWSRLSSIPPDRLSVAFGVAEPSSQASSEFRKLLKRAGDLEDQGKRREAFDVTGQALAIAESEGLTELQAEALVSLCLMSSQRAGLGDRDHYFRQLESIKESIEDAALLVLFHRAHAACLQDKGDLRGAESAYLAAIETAGLPENVEDCGAHLCVARSEYAHLLCSSGRPDEAESHLQLAEAYAYQNPDVHNGEVFRAALDAGLHWAATAGDEDGAVMRVQALEGSASTAFRAINTAGELINAANSLSHSNCHRAALAAAEAALRLSHKMPRDQQETFLPGVLYTIAFIHFRAGRLKEALQKATALVNLPETDETAGIRFGAAQLVSVISRQTGDLVTAVEKAELATAIARETFSSFMAKMNLSEALADHGATERALQMAQDAYQLVDGRLDVPQELLLESLGQIAKLSAQVGKSDIVEGALTRLQELAGDNDSLADIQDRHMKVVEANIEIRRRLTEISLVEESLSVHQSGLARVKEFTRFVDSGNEDPSLTEEPVSSLRQANALTIAPVLKWWEDTREDLGAAALDYDYWGRGCFARVLRNLQAFPHSLNVTIEVRTVEDIRQALRLWALYADFVLLLWKGPTKSGRFMHLVDGEWFGPWGAGYSLALGTQCISKSGRHRYPAIGHASWLPDDVVKCLLTEASPFMASGQMLIVPASGVGCVSPGHGVMEQLLTEVANCIPAIQQRGGDELSVGLLPYAQNIPLDILFDFVNENESDLHDLRELLLIKTAHVRRNGLQDSPRALELEIAESLRRLRLHNTIIAKRRDLVGAEQDTHLGIAPFHVSGRGLVGSDDAIFSPLLTLESMGYGWKIGASAAARPGYRYKPGKEEAVGAWLAPPEPGAQFLVVKGAEDDATRE